MNKLVCGMVVDEDIYDKYNFDKKTGSRRMYTLCGQERSLMAIEFYANSADYAKESPEVVAEAKKIAEQIQREIREYYAAKDGRKEYVAMKHDTFDGYLKDLQEKRPGRLTGLSLVRNWQTASIHLYLILTGRKWCKAWGFDKRYFRYADYFNRRNKLARAWKWHC